MKTATTRQIIGCIGKCLSGLSVDELDALTDSVHNTLGRHQGRKIFREFLRKGKRQDDLKCLDFHEQCCRYIENDRDYVLSTPNSNVKMLINDVSEAFDTAIELERIPEIDMTILDKFNEALNTPRREALLQVLEETKLRLEEHLNVSHKDFRIYVREPCPSTR
ncbi:uncharacterized protein LOC107036418 [Diachasma alloeum]|uniref:uncharacterized protein LOC107036418 n=1 Tax=Diachasma alloeum TaxID=454923 RepID=UPI000738496D|nr:uncharacterized protein LOC107036418 [Diachasma alloeum]XP_015109852.1 uncharacterized protein LOC107036418 [Diachasma alloeum]XP_015109853.1 uncharacterized protein LOC107036418 [Diachasma alloeum]XP_015109854.1 uncharacterized protein LOC107036418 [Diachasma alloeum]